MPDATNDTRSWLAHQVAKYQHVLPVYTTFATTLDHVLESAAEQVAKQAIVQVRVKTIASFAEKALRKKHKHPDPVNQLTDLCGGRVITRIDSEVEAIGDFLEKHFEIDRANSVDTSERLRPTEFGYRSVHYIVSFRRDVDYGVEIPDELFRQPASPLEPPERAHQIGLRTPKAEVQVRTLLEHSYADFAHDLSYKGAFSVPDSWLRELAGAAAALERVGRTFTGIERRLADYASSYGAYLMDEELAHAIEMLNIILDHDWYNAQLTARLGKLLITAGEWDRAIVLLDDYRIEVGTADCPRPILRDLGIALCKRHRDRPESHEYRRGQVYLEYAAAPEHKDVDAVAALAGTWKGIDEKKVRELYRRAFGIDSADPYALVNYLECELEKGSAVLEHTRPQILKAMERCRSHIDVGINLPWAYYNLGEFHLLLGEPYESLDAYARALATSAATFMIETSLKSLDRLAEFSHDLEGLEWSRRLLALGLATRERSPSAVDRLTRLATPGAKPLKSPVVIVVGGADPSLDERMQQYRELLIQGFGDFEGTIISGGTTQGIPGLVGELAAAYPGRIKTVGYLPSYVPADATVDRDPSRYNELRQTNGHNFTPLEPIQNWIDLLCSQVSPADVKVVGINGGRIAGIEYRIALAFGAEVGVIADSGREVGRLVTDAYWSTEPRLLTLPRDTETLRAFLHTPLAEEVEETGLPDKLKEQVESLAKANHEAYRDARAAERSERDTAMSDWEQLPEELKESNRQQALDMVRKLGRVGYEVVDADGGGGAAEIVSFTEAEIESLAAMEHGRWNVERMSAGWSLGEERDVARKTSPYLVPWDDLPESIKDYDRRAVRRISESLATCGLGARKAE